MSTLETERSRRGASLGTQETDAPSAFLAVIALAFGIFLPFIIKGAMNATVSGWTLAPVIPITILGVWRRASETPSLGVRFFSAALPVVYAVIILTGIVITPFNAYLEWFDAVKTGQTGGPVSNLFILVASFFIAVIAPTMITTGIAWPVIVTLLVGSALGAVIFQSAGFFVLFALFIAGAFVYVGYRNLPWGKRTPVVAYSIGVAAVVMAVSGLLSAGYEAEGDEYVNTIVFPNLRRTVVGVLPEFPLIYGDPSYGLSFDEKRLGGIPTLSESPILSISGRGGESIYLRTSVFDFYDGSSWEKTTGFAESVDVKGLFDRGNRRAEDDLLVTFTAASFKALPSTLDTNGFVFPGRIPGIGGGNLDSGVSLSKGFDKGESVIIQRSGELPEIGRASVAIFDDESPFLQIPSDIPSDLIEIADGLSQGFSTRDEILSNIQAFLAFNYSYDLAPEEIAYEGDFVYSFLFNGAGGYCVHFATTFIILSRLNGIPARYATGYLAHIPSGEESVEVTGLSSHAWPEVWVDGQGWTTWEATSAVVPANYDEVAGQFLFRFGLAGNRSTSRQLSSMLGQNVGDSVGSDGGNSGFPWHIVVPSGVGAAIVLAIVLLISRFGLPVFFYRSTGNLDGKFKSSAKRMVRRLERAGVSHPEKTGWERWAEDVRALDIVDRATVSRVRRVLLETEYSQKPFNEESTRAIREFTREAEKGLKNTG